MVALSQENVRNGIMKIGLNEIALLTIIISPFIYLMTEKNIRCERKLNREERRKARK